VCSSDLIVKQTAKELGITQKELAERMGVTEDTISNWSRGKIETPKWALEMFKLLIKEKKFETIKRMISDELH
jgi:transcriptional regulator with XRE-family HTH domain